MSPQDSACLINSWHTEVLRVHIFERPHKLPNLNLLVITILLFTLLELRCFRLHMLKKKWREIIDLMRQEIFLPKYSFFLVLLIFLQLTFTMMW